MPSAQDAFPFPGMHSPLLYTLEFKIYHYLKSTRDLPFYSISTRLEEEWLE